MNLVELKELDLSGVNLKIYEGPIGISCSGGADSSLLLYFLMKYSKNKIYIFSSGNKARQFKNITITNNVIQKCIELNIKSVNILGDSKLVIKQLKKEYKVYGPANPHVVHILYWTSQQSGYFTL